ncbi:MAG: DUF2314 domain-containing protein [Planctomycetales bacterium]|nr:DUF2314 domain-containing protein [Planctomycetales bacterium]
MKAVTCFVVLMLGIVGCSGASSSSENFTTSDAYDEQEMEAAIQRARRETDVFIRELNSNSAEDFSVKAPISDGAAVEHFWLKDVTYRNEKFTGTIDNEPEMVANVRLGQEWSLAKDEISDWLYMKDGKMYGNYTVRPLLPSMPAEEAEFLKSILAEP